MRESRDGLVVTPGWTRRPEQSYTFGTYRSVGVGRRRVLTFALDPVFATNRVRTSDSPWLDGGGDVAEEARARQHDVGTVRPCGVERFAVDVRAERHDA